MQMQESLEIMPPKLTEPNSLNRVCLALQSSETYYSVKRDLLQCQKRPTTVSKETY
jgi:hypothetical protein